MHNRDQYSVFRVMAAVVSLVTMAGTFYAAGAGAMPPYATNSVSKPLVVVRFNQPTVHYQKALTNAVQRAMALKPGAMFNVVSYVPYTADPLINQRYLSVANAHLRDVSDTFMQMGVAVDKIVLSTELESQLKDDEVHVYVR